MAREPQHIDATIEVVTPENIEFKYRVAGPFRRLPAFLVDLGIRGVVLFALSMLLQTLVIPSIVLGDASLMYLANGLLMLAAYVFEWFYGGLFETYMNGQTPGKWLLGIRVVTVEGQPISGMQAMLRNLVRAVDLFPYVLIILPGPTPEAQAILPLPTGMVALVTMALNRRFQRLGDMVGGTMVVIEERTWLLGVAKLEDPRAAQLAAYLPPKFEVSRSLARALAAYVERRGFFSPPRRREIARHLAEPLLREFGLPLDTSHDLLLCALYYKAFVAEHGDESGPSPFSTVPQPQSQFQPPVYIPPPLPQEQMVTTGGGARGNPFIIRR
jgi:uncharacterized RDD family membrane protein YckC